jgi:rSAM/selenodomain-associated transferase 1
VAASRRERLVLFAKEPAAGRVKTRLAAGIGAGKAAALYGAILTDLAAALVAPSWEAVLAVEGDETVVLARIFSSNWSFRPQGPGSLGDRLARAAAAAFEEGAERVALAGSDAPTLGALEVGAAFAALDESDLAVAPAPDGGFSLAALKRLVNPIPLFGSVRWSTAFALSDLRRNADTFGLRAALLPQVPDVDVVEDLLPLRERLSADGRIAPATRAFLATI